MKRRKFIGTILGTTVAFELVSRFAMGNPLRNEKSGNFTPNELLQACKKYFDPIFFMQKVDLSLLPPKGLVILADSYEMEVNQAKNSIFDVAETVIKKTKQFGFNAESLRDGKIPEGMDVYSESISFKSNGKFYPMRIPELKAFDIEVYYRRPITINYRVPFSELIKEDSFKHLRSDDKYKIFQGKNTNARFFINMQDISRNYMVDDIEPFKIRSADNLNQPAFSKEVFSKHVTDGFSKLIFS